MGKSFSKIHKTYFGSRVVKSVSEPDEKNLVRVTYSDDRRPPYELIHVTEWEDGKTDKPIERPPDRQAWFVTRTRKMRQSVLDAVIAFNPRFSDMKKIISWIDEGINMTYKNVVNAVFGLENFDNDATIEFVSAWAESHGGIDMEKWTPFEREVFAFMRRDGTKVFEILNQSKLGGLQEKIGNLVTETVSDALGSTDEYRRCNEFEELLKKHDIHAEDSSKP